MNSLEGSAASPVTDHGNPTAKKIILGLGLAIAISAFVIGVLAILASNGIVNIHGLNALTSGALLVLSFGAIVVLVLKWRQDNSVQNVNDTNTTDTNQNQVNEQERQNRLLDESWRLKQSFQHFTSANNAFERERVLQAVSLIREAVPAEGERDIVEAARFYSLERVQAIIYLMLQNELNYAYFARSFIYCSKAQLTEARREEIVSGRVGEYVHLLERREGTVLYSHHER